MLELSSNNFLLALPVLATAIGLSIKEFFSDKISGFFALFIGVVLTAAAWVAPYCWQLHWLYGGAQALVSYLGLLTLMILVYVPLSGPGGKIYDNTILMTSPWLLAFISLTIAVPAAIVPQMKSNTAHDQSPPGEIELNTEFIEDSLTINKGSLRSAQASNDHENKVVNDAINGLLKDLEARNTAIRELEQQEAEMLAEIRQLREISTISENQAHAIIKALNKGKYFDYLMGFVIGLASSGMIQAIVHLRKKK